MVTACAGNDAELRVEQKAMTVVALGTSLTDSGGWTKPLEERLAECLARPIRVLNFGRDGATSDWAVAILGKVIRAQPDVILIEFAVNDASWLKGVSLRHSQENIIKIVRAVKEACPQAMIFLMTMSPAFGVRGWMRPQLKKYYEIYKDISNNLGIGYIDNLQKWKNLTEHDLRASMPDGLHPLPEWASRILVPMIAGAIGGMSCADTRNTGR